MTSTNHFRNRQASTNKPAPLSPRHKRRYVPPTEPTPTTPYADWSIDSVTSTGNCLFSFRRTVFTTKVGNVWDVLMVDAAGHPCRLRLQWNAPINQLFGNIACDRGGGLTTVSTAVDNSYAPAVPYTSPVMNWPNFNISTSGTIQIFLPIAWVA